MDARIRNEVRNRVEQLAVQAGQLAQAASDSESRRQALRHETDCRDLLMVLHVDEIAHLHSPRHSGDGADTSDPMPRAHNDRSRKASKRSTYDNPRGRVLSATATTGNPGHDDR